MRAGLDYIAGRVDRDGAVYVIDVGRDAVHSEPMIIGTWDDDTSEELGSFVESIFDPEHLAKNYSPDENVRVAYDDDLNPDPGEYRGEWDGVEFYDVSTDDRLRFRKENEESYRPDSDALDQFYRLLS